MQVAAFLSDLKSLSICSHEAAIAVVVPENVGQRAQTPARPNTGFISSTTEPLPLGLANDQELTRANELVSLHHNVKVKYLETGPDPELEQAAAMVDRVIQDLKT
ncbi:hypothetical protein PV08_11120 [Exophiala spinifera]|uniref:Uncharacterized protein n=1 Tax=Exophiala spinifera TaxID=91928 RepID=A0A0D2BFM1_9EURO|nr:uncharacterized protein PV08_11120 [Exophiala spinifera]KIW10159.1 hypothetical protein PV08_11120 [Exophiala spinifera]